MAECELRREWPETPAIPRLADTGEPGRGWLFGQDQSILPRNPQPVFLSRMADQQLVPSVEQRLRVITNRGCRHLSL